MSDIDIAVVIVTYRCAELTIECLCSIEAERPAKGIEIRALVVDTASGDAAPIAHAIETNRWSSWVTLIEAPKNGGFAYGNNLAFQRAYDDGPPTYIHLLNPDTRVLKGAISDLVCFLEMHPDVGIAGSRLSDADGNDLSFAFRFPSIVSEFEHGFQFGMVRRMLQPWVVAIKGPAEPQLVDWVSAASMMIRRKVIDSIGGLDENYFLYFEDPDFCFRAKKAGFKTWCVPASHIIHLSGQSTHVTGHQEGAKRYPSYWFESRRRYFVANYGLPYAIATDVTSLLAHGLGSVKRLLQGRMGQGIPYVTRDLARHSLLWPKNRQSAPIKSFVPRP
jgi:GT2 family glycosyltransferase